MKYCIKNYMECEHFVQKTPRHTSEITDRIPGMMTVEKTPFFSN